LGSGPPSIFFHPLSQTIPLGSNATFRVTAIGAAPLRYQWRFEGADIAGATNAALPLNSVNTNQAGAYSVVVANPEGALTSLVASLTILLPPSILVQPQSQVVSIAGVATF